MITTGTLKKVMIELLGAALNAQQGPDVRYMTDTQKSYIGSTLSDWTRSDAFRLQERSKFVERYELTLPGSTPERELVLEITRMGESCYGGLYSSNPSLPAEEFPLSEAWVAALLAQG